MHCVVYRDKRISTSTWPKSCSRAWSREGEGTALQPRPFGLAERNPRLEVERKNRGEGRRSNEDRGAANASTATYLDLRFRHVFGLYRVSVANRSIARRSLLTRPLTIILLSPEVGAALVAGVALPPPRAGLVALLIPPTGAAAGREARGALRRRPPADLREALWISSRL